ncbi:MAG: SET domain-containing protein [Planctomycetota bacterium]
MGRSTIHGMGLFAATRIKKGARIGQMEGVERKRSNDHVLWIEEDDGRVWGLEGLNEFRFTNHSDEPNAVFYGAELFALRTIEAGEEITFDYGGEVVPAD